MANVAPQSKGPFKIVTVLTLLLGFEGKAQGALSFKSFSSVCECSFSNRCLTYWHFERRINLANLEDLGYFKM